MGWGVKFISKTVVHSLKKYSALWHNFCIIVEGPLVFWDILVSIFFSILNIYLVF
jgi:hypothetical protein